VEDRAALCADVASLPAAADGHVARTRCDCVSTTHCGSTGFTQIDAASIDFVDGGRGLGGMDYEAAQKRQGGMARRQRKGRLTVWPRTGAAAMSVELLQGPREFACSVSPEFQRVVATSVAATLVGELRLRSFRQSRRRSASSKRRVLGQQLTVE
jgi:hypothetical protein